MHTTKFRLESVSHWSRRCNQNHVVCLHRLPTRGSVRESNYYLDSPNVLVCTYLWFRRLKQIENIKNNCEQNIFNFLSSAIKIDLKTTTYITDVIYILPIPDVSVAIKRKLGVIRTLRVRVNFT